MLTKTLCAWGIVGAVGLIHAQTEVAPKPWKDASIATAFGSFTIDGVDVGDTFPPGCSGSGNDCRPANAGYKVLVVWLKTTGDASKASFDLMSLLGKVAVKSDDGERTENFSGGGMNSRLFVAFTPPVAGKNFVLYWDENAPISLGRE